MVLEYCSRSLIFTYSKYLFWSLDKGQFTLGGQFSVKSTHEAFIQAQPTKPSRLDPTNLNCIWNLELQHKLKHLL